MEEPDLRIRSKLIVNAKCNADTEAAIREAQQVPADGGIMFCIFEVEIDNLIRYCCWSGGTMKVGRGGRPSPEFTLTGLGAFEALQNLPFVSSETAVVIQELRKGPTALRDKVISAFRKTADTRELICFIGNMETDLTDAIGVTLNLVDRIDIEECVGHRSPNRDPY